MEHETRKIVFKDSEKGQALIITALIFSVIFAISVALGGWSVTQLRATNDFVNSVVAISAADAGVECMLYKDLKDSSQECNTSFVFSNGAKLKQLCNGFPGIGDEICSNTSCLDVGMASLQATAEYGRSIRAYELCFGF